jgi:NAD(P)-dependent dehydrogenase (short-subunit alcohol dehydrogenase family)
MTPRWSEADIGDQSGRVALVTGANSGLGFETARALAQHGAHVVLGCRNPQRAAEAAARIDALSPRGTVEILPIDMGDLTVIDAAASDFVARHDRLDLLINNAGIALVPRSTTPQGFESQFGVNHLGPFALTARLLPTLLRTDGSRVVAITSYMHRLGRMSFADLHGERRYSASGAYTQSKLANLLFTTELDRRLRAVGATTIAVAAHPGLTATTLGHDSASPLGRLLNGLRPILRHVMQDPADGALPTLRAATDAAAAGNDLYGPYGRLESSGSAHTVSRSALSRDEHAAQKLWQLSVAATGADFGVLDQNLP